MTKPMQLRKHSMANYPLRVLSQLEKTHKFDQLPNLKNFPSASRKAISNNKLRIACTSDIFDNITKLVDSCPPADILIIAGNISRTSKWTDIVKFRKSLDDLPTTYKILVPGSSDYCFNLEDLTDEQAKQCERNTIKKELKLLGLKHISQYLNNVIYLQDMGVEIAGVKFYGSPWVSTNKTAAFYCSRNEIMKKWNRIPRGIDVLITCQPPLGHGDADYIEEHLGDVDLLAFGMSFNGYTYFVNSAMCTRSYNPSNDFIVFDVPMPDRASKSSPNINYFTGLVQNSIIRKKL
ncbi:unnamed protein product [Rotaria magnacalcarata]|uniref:Calcineurin-like phosphoesterase domain-containing protein n=2 Tax=Rotaria magnacalcarata TaxID=392030 RepID=A0A816TWU1_9BILA|nr:unnamed protein product [Rotaria magnacalcarata]CAF2099517.1 unnamed protein product [Rotaria magnacalcarata]CAF2101786.1 unnamed protein product [Rotaria magnacalcarata]CAF2142390.1 unnamed protein product [Rotaria magnacalcarata]